MGRHYSDEYKNELKQRVDIATLATQIMTIKKFGANYLGGCPLHKDDKPSFQINPVSNTFYCHSCGAGSQNHSRIRSSDVISFYMNFFNKGFHQAMEELSAMAGMQLPAMNAEEEQQYRQRMQWIENCKQTQLRFRENLANNKEAIKYLLNRGINVTNIDRWEIGFGDDQDQNFKNTKGRITFPLYDYDGNIISFTGRVPWSARHLTDVNERRKTEGKNPIVKYLDPYGFSKNQHLYGIHYAKEAIRAWRTAIIVEGWTDVISCHDKGLRHTVCSMGVALSKTQIQLLKRAGAENVIIMRDGDKAGQDASERDAKLLKENGIKPYILPLPDGMDPDDFAQSYHIFDTDISKYVFERRMSFEQWHIMREWKKNEDEIVYHLTQAQHQQVERREAVIKTLKQVQEPGMRNNLITLVANLLFTTRESVQEMMDKLGENN